MVKLFMDTNSDVTPEDAKEYGFSLIKMPYFIDGVEYVPYESWETYDYHKHFDILRNGAIPKTNAISPDEYIKYFEPVFAEGNDILYVHFSAAMSGTFNAMRIALDELKEKYPERKFYEVDTKGITLGSVNICLEIADMYKAGKSVEEILKWAETEVDHFAIYLYADDLSFFHRMGRVNGLSSFFGNLIGIKPIIYMSSEGKMETFSKFRGKKNALTQLVNRVAEIGDDIKNHRIIIGHSDALDIAELLAKMMRERFGDDLNISYRVVNATAGCHCGPDGVGISFHSKCR